MTASPAKAAALALCLAAMLPGTDVLAQNTAQPQPLVRPFDPETMERADPPAYENVGSIEAQTLKAPSPEAAGTLTPAQGGFPATLWTGTSAAVVRALLPMLPAGSDSQVLRQIERRLLSTAAPPPQGAEANARPSLVELRADRLLAMGDVDGALGLTSAAPSVVEGAVAARVRRDANLLAGRIDQACAQAQPGSATDADAARLQVFCRYSQGKTLEGNLALDLLRERKGADPAFIAAAETLAGLPPVPNARIEITELSPLHVALFGAAKMPIPPAMMAKATPAVAQAVAGNVVMSPDLRAAAAERALALGAMAPDAVRRLYLDMVFAPDEMAAPLDRAAGAGFRGRALLFRAATDQPDPMLKARFTAKAMELAAGQGRIGPAARVFEHLLMAVTPDPLLAREAPSLARALYALGQTDQAARWLDIAKGDAQATQQARSLWPLTAAAAAIPGGMVDQMALIGWRSSLTGVAPQVAARRAAVVLGVLSGLGAKLPDAAWLDALVLPGAGPRPALFGLMQAAALDARQGGTVLAALAALGDVGLDQADPLTLGETVSALAVVGLADEARALAVEAMLANGV